MDFERFKLEPGNFGINETYIPNPTLVKSLHRIESTGTTFEAVSAVESLSLADRERAKGTVDASQL